MSDLKSKSSTEKVFGATALTEDEWFAVADAKHGEYVVMDGDTVYWPPAPYGEAMASWWGIRHHPHARVVEKHERARVFAAQVRGAR